MAYYYNYGCNPCYRPSYNSCYNSYYNRCYNYCGYYRPYPPFPGPGPGPNPGTGNNLSAQNTTGAALTVAATGTAIPLPNQQTLNNFTVDATNTVFTVPTTGTYMIAYQVNLTSAVLAAAQVVVNGVALAGSVGTSPVPTSSFSGMTTVTLNAGDRVSLQLINYTGTVTLAAPVGARLTIMQVA